MPQAQPLQSPAVKRSELLAKLLEEGRKPPQMIGGYGDLGARLLAQGLTQWASGRADRAVQTEQDEALRRRQDALASLVAQTGQPTAQGPSLAGIVENAGNPIPMDAGDAQLIASQGTGAVQSQPQPQQGGIPAALAQRIQQLSVAGPEGLAQAEQLANNYLNQQAQMGVAAQYVGNDPRLQYLFAVNPEAASKSLSEQYSPQVISEGGVQRVAGSGETFSNPRTTVINDTMYRGDQPVATAPPGYEDQVAQGRLALDQQNAGFTLGTQRYDPQGRLIAEAPEQFTLSPGQTRFEEGAPVAAVAATADPNTARAREASNAAALQAIGNTRSAIDRARGQVGFWTTGPLAQLPLNTPARDLNATLDTIKANLSFNELAQMRANSPTGGALGSIAVRELDLLGSTVASLDQAQSREELERSLGIIEESLARWEAAVKEGQQAAPTDQPQGGVSRDAAIAEARRRGLIP